MTAQNTSQTNYINDNNQSINNYISSQNDSWFTTYNETTNQTISNALATIGFNQTTNDSITNSVTENTNLINSNNQSVNNYILETNTTQSSWVDLFFVRFTEIVDEVGNWTLDKVNYYTSTEVDAINTSVNNYILDNNNSVNSYIVAYSDGNNDSMKSYVDIQDIVFNNSIVNWITDQYYTSTQVDAINTSVTNSIISNNESMNNRITDENTSISNALANRYTKAESDAENTSQINAMTAQNTSQTNYINNQNTSVSNALSNRYTKAESDALNTSQTNYINSQNTSVTNSIIDNNLSMNSYVLFVNGTAASYTDYVNTTAAAYTDAKLITTFFNATNVNPVTGTPAGTVVDLRDKNDISYNLSEVSSDMALIINFTGIIDFNQIIYRYKSAATEGHVMSVQVWDYTNLEWENFDHLGNTENEYIIRTETMYDDENHIGTGASDGVVQLRFFSNNAGGSTHLHQFDWVSISNGPATPSSEETDPHAIHTDGMMSFTANWDQGAFNLTSITSWFNGLVDWTSINGLNSTMTQMVWSQLGNSTMFTSAEANNGTYSVVDTNAETECSGALYLAGNGTCTAVVAGEDTSKVSWADSNNGTIFDINKVEWADVANGTIPDTNAQTECSGATYLAGNGTCVGVVDTTIANTNAATICAGALYLAGNGTCTTELDTDTTYTAGTGLTLSTFEFSHTDSTSQANSSNSGFTYIQDVLLDSLGHIQGMTSAIISTATPANGVTTSLSTADQIFDYIAGLAHATVAYVDTQNTSQNNRMDDLFVPYTGADKNIVLGNNDFSVGGTDFFVDNVNGMVGIGLSNPTKTLDVLGSILINGTNADGDRLYFKSVGNTDWAINNFNGIFRLFNGEGGNAVFQIEANALSNSIYIEDSGEVGIHATEPQRTLHVNGAILANATINSTVDVCIETGDCLGQMATTVYVNTQNTSMKNYGDSTFTTEAYVNTQNTSMKNYGDSTFQTILTNAAGLYSALSDVTLFLESLIDDTSPQLGGYLDTNAQNIGSTSDEIENIYVGDNTRVYFGDSQDASIYWNGSALITG